MVLTLHKALTLQGSRDAETSIGDCANDEIYKPSLMTLFASGVGATDYDAAMIRSFVSVRTFRSMLV